MIDFPPVYIVTIKELEYRRPMTQAQFDLYGIKPIWVEGLNAVHLGIRSGVPHEYQKDGTPLFIHPKVLSIAMNHFLTLQRALSDGAEEFFIMEDDVVLSEGFRDKWERISKVVPDDIEVIQCAISCWEDKTKKMLNEHLCHYYYPFNAACNWWRKSGAQFAVQRFPPLGSPADVILADRIYPFIGHANTVLRIASEHSRMGARGKWPQTYLKPNEDPVK